MRNFRVGENRPFLFDYGMVMNHGDTAKTRSEKKGKRNNGWGRICTDEEEENCIHKSDSAAPLFGKQALKFLVGEIPRPGFKPVDKFIMMAHSEAPCLIIQGKQRECNCFIVAFMDSCQENRVLAGCCGWNCHDCITLPCCITGERKHQTIDLLNQ
jgi:hypothetical protein